MQIEFEGGFFNGRGTGLERGARFDAPCEIIRADTSEEVADAFARIEAVRNAGKWVAGAFSYELGYVFEPTLLPLLPAKRRVPLIELGVYDTPCQADPISTPVADCALTPRWSQEDYLPAFEQVQAYISAGDIYQANLTFPIAFETSASPRDLYLALKARQEVGYGALITREDGSAVLSRSPELFFDLAANGGITVRPMKGTVKRGETVSADEQAKAWLSGSEKNQAENLMIVDLLRNDLSRISEIGSVKVPKLFEIETYATVHQMTSTITAQLGGGGGAYDLFRALFPCGSITGAPKIRAMEIIRKLEPWERGLYCGAIGWFAPDGAAKFNVAIRTLEMAADGTGTLAVGGGLVHDSAGPSEYAEALLKAEFAAL